jgi:hypothetical protein
MQDTASHSAPQLDNGELRHTLSVHDVGAALVTAGVPRSHRQIIRYCETAMLDAVKVPGPTGPQWYVSPSSVPKAIGDLKQWEAQRAGRSSSQQDTSDRVGLEKERDNNSDTASHGALQPAVSDKQPSQKGSETEPATARYVALLERDNEFLREQVTKKDEQITDLSKRFGETQTLLGAMQRMLAPLLGQSDPFNHPEKREVDEPNMA